jgi:hypothetical protein
MTLDREITKEITHRITLASSSFNNLQYIWSSNILSKTTKLRLHNSNIVPVLTYGSESWKAKKTLNRKLNVLEQY